MTSLFCEPLKPGKHNIYVKSHYNDIQNPRRYTVSYHDRKYISIMYTILSDVPSYIGSVMHINTAPFHKISLSHKRNTFNLFHMHHSHHSIKNWHDMQIDLGMLRIYSP